MAVAAGLLAVQAVLIAAAADPAVGLVAAAGAAVPAGVPVEAGIAAADLATNTPY